MEGISINRDSKDKMLESLKLSRTLFIGFTSTLATALIMAISSQHGTVGRFMIWVASLNLILNLLRSTVGAVISASADDRIVSLWASIYRWTSHVTNITWSIILFTVVVSNGLGSHLSILALIMSFLLIGCSEFAFPTMLDLRFSIILTMGFSFSISAIYVGSSLIDYLIGGFTSVVSAIISLNAWQTYLIMITNNETFHDKTNQNLMMLSMLNATPGFMTLIDATELRYVMVNDAFKNSIGRDVIGQVVGSVERDQEFHRLLLAFRESNERRVISEVQLGSGPNRHHYLLSLARVDGDRPMISVLSINIEDRKKTELALAKARSDAEHSSRLAALGEMVSSVAHEIRNPLTIISARALNLSNITKNGQMTFETAEEEGKKIASMVDRISKIIGNVLKFSRGDADAPMSKIVLANLIEDVRFLTEIKCKTSQVTLKVQPIDRSIELDCFPLQLSQVLVNLINNAIDAIEGLESKWIEISAKADEMHIEIRVVDCGLGIPKDIRDKMLQPFFTTKPAGKGTGLGLSISRGIVEKHLGKLWIDSEASHTTFVIEIPRIAIAVAPTSRSA